MNLDDADLDTIKYISVFFLIVLIVSLYLSLTKEKSDNLIYMPFSNITKNTSSEDCDFCENKDISAYINKKINESGIFDVLNSLQNEYSVSQAKVSDTTIPNFDDLKISNCTPLFYFTDMVKYSKDYKYTLNEDYIIYSKDRLVEKKNSFYVVESVSDMFLLNEKKSLTIESYYSEDGKCVYSSYYQDSNEKPNEIECSTDYNTILCKEIIDSLNYIGDEKYSTLDGIYDVFVYANEDNSTILKYGKEIPVLFYFEKVDNANKRLKIELLNVEEGNYEE